MQQQTFLSNKPVRRRGGPYTPKVELPPESTQDAISRILNNNARGNGYPAINAALDNQSKFDVIDEYLHRTQAIGDEFDHALNLEISALQSQRNRYASIHKLPVELLVYIFRLSLPPPEDGDWYVENLQDLLEVCKYWNSTIRLASSLWSVITSSHGPDWFALSLKKSGTTSPLHIFCNFLPQEEFAPVLQLIAPHIHRWETAEILMPETPEGREYLSAPAPNLRRLDLSLPVPPPEEDEDEEELDYNPFDIFNGSADRLEEVKLTYTCIPWDSPILRGLKSFHLKFCPPIRVSNIITILNECPGLQTLIVKYTTITMDMQTDPSRAVTMTELENITLEAKELEGVREVFKGFKAPNCQSFDFILAIGDYDHIEEFLLTTLAPFFPFFRRMMFEHPRTVVNKSIPHHFNIRCSPTTEMEEGPVWFNLNLEGTPSSLLTAFLRQVLGEGESSKPDVRLIIRRDYGKGGIAIIDEVLSYCNVVDLWLGADESIQDFGAEGVLRSLTKAAYLPHLRRLIISGDGWDGGEVVKILRARYRRAKKQTPSLRILLIGRGLNAHPNLAITLRALSKIEHVTWDGNFEAMPPSYR
ncbi:hypothetical protein FRC01_002268 [Tulasnella sp. 417]|nr:hypothetical protein FRC01_002268 [Tulasnella sp. 417]